MTELTHQKRTVLILGAADSNGDDKDWGFQAIDSSYYSSNYVTPYAPGDNVGTGGSTSYYSTQVKTTVNIGDDSIYANYLNYNSFSNSGYIKIDNEIIYYSQKERTRPDPQHYYDTIIFLVLTWYYGFNRNFTFCKWKYISI